MDSRMQPIADLKEKMMTDFKTAKDIGIDEEEFAKINGVPTNEPKQEDTPQNRWANMDQDERRFKSLLHTIFYITRLAGFNIEGRITFVDKRTGKRYE